MKLVLMLALLSCSAKAATENSPPNFSKVKIDYWFQGKPSQTAPAVLSWDLSKKKCQAKFSKSEPKLHLKAGTFSIPPELCKGLKALLDENWKNLAEQSELGMSAANRASRHGPHIPLAEFHLLNWHLGSLRSLTETCDLAKVDCHPASKRPVDLVGTQIRELLTEAQ